MKKYLAALGLGVLMWTVPAGAQSAPMRFDIPFSFAAGEQTLPSGSYRVTVDQDFSLARFESLSDTSVHVVHLVPGRTERQFDGASAGRVRFARFGDKYFLTGLWKSGSISGNDTIPSKRQLESARSAAAAAQMVNLSSNN